MDFSIQNIIERDTSTFKWWRKSWENRHVLEPESSKPWMKGALWWYTLILLPYLFEINSDTSNIGSIYLRLEYYKSIHDV